MLTLFEIILLSFIFMYVLIFSYWSQLFVLFQLQWYPLQKVTNILTLFKIRVLCLFQCCKLFLLITTFCFIPAPDISTTEGNKIDNTIWNYISLFYCYVLIFIYWSQLFVLFQLLTYPLQKVTNMLTLF